MSKLGEANEDTISDFEGGGSGSVDKIVLVNYGKNASFVYLHDNIWVVNTADGKMVEEFKVTNAAAMVPGEIVRRTRLVCAIRHDE